MNNKYEPLDHNDVLFVNPEDLGELEMSKTLKVIELIEAIEQYIGASQEEATWIDCEVLQQGKRWKKGKIRLTFEFCPEEPSEPPSPLDDIRKQLKEADG